MAVQLMRDTLRPLYRQAQDAHPGLLLQRGYESFDDQTDAGKQRKTAHIELICGLPSSAFYTHAFQRWRTFTRDPQRFYALELDLETRLFIGLTGSGALETGCALSHTYGMPYIPGSSVKGVINAWVRRSAYGKEHPEVCDALFGAEPTPDDPEGLAGGIAFHDAWWVPDSAATPFAQEVVTTHHLHYYGSEGETWATDLDSPIPNAQIAVRGRFLFVIEGPPGWLPLVAEMLQGALANQGIGAKTSSGYGFFRVPEAGTGGGAKTVRCPWVEDAMAALITRHRAKEDETLRGKGLAGEWQAIANADLKAEALADIQARWQAKGWWDNPPGGAARQAKAIYSAG